MSDLQCAATMLVTPHGEGEYDDTRALAESFRGRRVAIVYTSSAPPAVEAAEVAADVLQTQLRVLDGLRGPSAGDTDDGVVERVTGELESIADLHRGETVLVVADRDVLTLVLPSLVRDLGRRQVAGRELSAATAVELSADADGWVCRSWAGDVPE